VTEGLVLTLDGSSRVCGVALVAPVLGQVGAGAARTLSRWRLVGRGLAGENEGGARSLLRLLDGVLQEAGASPRDVRAVVVGIGPGTFTGVRLAVATARALALSVRRPVWGVSTLGALAARAALEIEVAAERMDARPQRIVPFVDARRGQLFYTVYEALPPQASGAWETVGLRPTGGDWAAPGHVPGPAWRRRGGYGVCDRDELAAKAVAGVHRGLLVGEVEALGPELPAGWSTVSCVVSPEHLVLGQDLLLEPAEESGGCRTSAWLAEAVDKAGESWAGDPPGGPGTPEAVKPIYVRSPDADLHITKMRDPWA
jgi:tRNA threonylcarbamoyl adenosine modification protein YeaZ